MPFHLLAPSESRLDAMLERARTAPWTFAEAGLTEGLDRTLDLPPERVPRGFVLDRYGADLGRDCFASAREALQAFAQYPEWIRVHIREPVAAGTPFIACPRHLGFHSTLPCRILYTVDEPDRYAFTLATVEGHAECGEERFEVAVHPGGQVRYDVVAVSRPALLLARLGAPFARYLQRRFQREGPARLRATIEARGAG